MSKQIEAFTFGDPEPVMNRADITQYFESWWNNRWYEPPVSFSGLAKSFRSNAHHSSAIYVKRNVLLKTLKPNTKLSTQTASRLFLDYLTFGNCFAEKIVDRVGRLIRIDSSMAKYTRRGKDKDQFWFVPLLGNEHEFTAGSVFHLMEPDVNQEVYGVPEYISGLQSAWLNESATLFRRKYYLNGSHAGFILYLTDEQVETDDVDKIKQALKDSKGPGNFRNLFLHAPGGKTDGLKLIPVAEVQAKDEFFNIKNVTRDDVLAAHRVPPQIMGIVPTNSAGFGSAEVASKVFSQNEIEPLQARFKELNDWLGETVIDWHPYQLDQVSSA